MSDTTHSVPVCFRHDIRRAETLMDRVSPPYFSTASLPDNVEVVPAASSSQIRRNSAREAADMKSERSRPTRAAGDVAPNSSAAISLVCTIVWVESRMRTADGESAQNSVTASSEAKTAWDPGPVKWSVETAKTPFPSTARNGRFPVSPRKAQCTGAEQAILRSTASRNAQLMPLIILKSNYFSTSSRANSLSTPRWIFAPFGPSATGNSPNACIRTGTLKAASPLAQERRTTSRSNN